MSCGVNNPKCIFNVSKKKRRKKREHALGSAELYKMQKSVNTKQLAINVPYVP